MRTANGRPIPDQAEFAAMGESFQAAVSLWADIIEEAANILGGTADADKLQLDPASGIALTFSGTPGQAIVIGTSSTELSYTEGTPLFDMYATNAGTDGSTSAEPFYVKSTLTGAGQVGGRCRFHCYSNVASGGWVNALKAYMEFGSSGRTTGLASAMNCEMTMPNATIASGAYFPLELEMIDASSTSYTGNFGFMYGNITGTKTNFDAYGVFFWINGLTAGATKCLSLTSQTLKCKVAAAATTRYMVLSQLEDGLGLGNSTTAMTLTTYANRAVEIYTTCASTDASNSVEPLYVKSTMTGAAGVGGRSRFHMYTNVALGSWSNALKAYAEYGSSGKTTGLGSALCAEMLLSAGTTSGTYAPLESELVADSAVASGTATSFLYMNIAGSNSTGKTTLNTNAFLFELGTGVVDTTSGLFDTFSEITPKCIASLRIRIGGVSYYIPIHTEADFAA